MPAPAVTHASLHHAIIRHVVDRGHAPSRAQLAARFGVDDAEMTRALEDLQAYHGVVLHPHTAEVWVIHPFATAPTLFTVRHGDRLWWGNCTWCSLGAAALLGGDGITIDTVLGGDGPPVSIHVDGHRVREDLLVHFPVPMTRAWDNVIFTCSLMLAFADAPAIDVWASRHALPRGDVQPIQRVYDFARVWYGRHLEHDWRKWTLEEAREIFAGFKFTGPVWDLPRVEGTF